MGLSQSDIRRIAGFARKVTKAPSVETVISETFETLKAIANIKEMRIVYSPAPSSWKEWKASPDSVEVRPHDEWPAPGSKEIALLFDPDDEQSGFVSVDKKGEKVRDTLEIMAPEIWSALLLQSALKRVQKAAISEAELVRETFRARDEERRHISRELHDDLGQSMASLKLGLKWAEDIVRPKPGMEEVVKELSTARNDVGTMLEKIRDLSHTLYPRMMSSGFWTIRQRMADLGGAFRLSTSQGHGAVVELIVPYSSRKSYARGKNKTAHRR